MVNPAGHSMDDMVGNECNSTERQEIGEKKLLTILIWHTHSAKMYPEISGIFSRS